MSVLRLLPDVDFCVCWDRGRGGSLSPVSQDVYECTRRPGPDGQTLYFVAIISFERLRLTEACQIQAVAFHPSSSSRSHILEVEAAGSVYP